MINYVPKITRNEGLCSMEKVSLSARSNLLQNLINHTIQFLMPTRSKLIPRLAELERRVAALETKERPRLNNNEN